MSRSLPIAWTKHLRDKEKKEQFEQAVRASTTALGRLIEIIEEESKALEKSNLTVKDFDDPSWAYKQAYKNGEKAGLNKVRELLEFIKG